MVSSLKTLQIDQTNNKIFCKDFCPASNKRSNQKNMPREGFDLYEQLSRLPIT